MNSMIVKLICILFLLLSVTSLLAQTSKDSPQQGDKVIIKMKDGEQFRGKILELGEKNIRIQTPNGEVSIVRDNVKSIKSDLYKGKFRFENPSPTRYFFGTSGIPIKKGTGYYKNRMVAFNSVNYGITKNFSIGGGLEFYSLISTGAPIWFLTPKIGFQLSNNLHAGAGVIVLGYSNKGTAGLGYGVLTIGNSDSQASLGAGYAMAAAGDIIASRPWLMFAGTHRVSNSIALLSENHLIPLGERSVYLGIHGIRILAKKNTYDVGFFTASSLSEYLMVPAIPYVSYSRAF